MNIRKVFSSSIVNLAYQFVPAITAIVMIPLTIKWFGSDLFSIYSLSISIIVLFNYLNFGVAQSTSRELAKEFTSKDYLKKNIIISSGLTAIILVGSTISLLGYFFVDTLASSLTSKVPTLFTVAKIMFGDVLFWSPLFLLIIFLRAVLEASLLFKYTSLNRALLNSLIFFSPAVCYLLEIGIEWTIKVVIFGHLISLLTLTYILFKSNDKLKFIFSRGMFLLLISSGSWLTIISLSSIGLLYADKFIIGNALGLTLLAYYVAAYDLISRASIVYGSLTAAFYPAFSYWYTEKDYNTLKLSVDSIHSLLAIVMIGGLSFIILFSNEIIQYWISADYSKTSAAVLDVLCVGIFFSSLSIVNMRLLCAIGREKEVAVYYIVQSVGYVLISYFLVDKIGLLGIAWLFSIRALLELLVLRKMTVSALSPFINISKKATLINLSGGGALIILLCLKGLKIEIRVLIAISIALLSLYILLNLKNNIKMLLSKSKRKII